VTTRRAFLARAAATAGVATAARSGVLDLSVLAGGAPTRATPTPRLPGRLVVVFLRGGQDALSTVVPYTRSSYYDARPTIAVPADVVLDLDGEWGLHPALPQLHDLYGAGRLAVVVCTGNPAQDESHFGAQDLMEYGETTAGSASRGWLARALDATARPSDSVFRAVTVGHRVDRSLRGTPAVGLSSIEGFGLAKPGRVGRRPEQMLRAGYRGASPVETTGIRTLDAIRRLGGVRGTRDPDRRGQHFTDAATLLAGDLGVDVVTVNIYGWDTHTEMGTHAAGRMRGLLAGLDAHLGAFQAELDRRGLTDVTTVVMTEFGRRFDENGSGGTDHGNGMHMLVLGGQVRGGQVLGRWGPPVDDQGARNVARTTDFRDVLGELVTGVLGVPAATVFPGHRVTPLGLLAA